MFVCIIAIYISSIQKALKTLFSKIEKCWIYLNDTGYVGWYYQKSSIDDLMPTKNIKFSKSSNLA